MVLNPHRYFYNVIIKYNSLRDSININTDIIANLTRSFKLGC